MGDKHGKFDNVYIKNFGEELDGEKLSEMFEQYGKIISAKVMYDDNGKSRGFGFVRFEEPEAAEKAVTVLNGTEIGGKKLYCGPAQKKAERQAEIIEEVRLKRIYQVDNLYVKNLDASVDDESLIKGFSQFGTITSAKVMYDDNGKSRGFGFVRFEEPEAAEKAMTVLNGTEIGGKQLYCGPAQKKDERQAELKEKFEKIKLERINRNQGVNLYVKNLDTRVDDESLRKEFSQFGNITSAKVMKEAGRSRGFGFVCFSSPEEATKAVTEMNGHIFMSKPLYVALAQRKEDRRAHLATQDIQRLASLRQQNVPYKPINNARGAGYFFPIMPQFQRGFFTPFIRHVHTPWAPGVSGCYSKPQQTVVIPAQNPLTASILAAAAPQKKMLGEQSVVIPGQDPLTASILAAAPHQKQMLGEQSVVIPEQDPLTASILAAAPSQEQKQMLGEQSVVIPAKDPLTASILAAAPSQEQKQMLGEQSVVIPGQDPLTASMLAAAPPQEQKQMLGEKLFPLIQRMYPDLAASITCMLLQFYNSELLHILGSQDSLKLKVEEAVAVLQTQKATETASKKE